MKKPTTIRFTRRGLTLVELLVAMVVLLVGIYTVAAGFPRLLYAIRGEGDRTGMTRLAEQAMTRMSDNQYGLPEAITGGGSIETQSYPEDLTAPHMALNAQEDITEVRGEALRVPGPYNAPGLGAGVGFGRYVLGQGPAECTSLPNQDAYPLVYMLVPLTERFDDPRSASAVPYDSPNWFYVDKRSGEMVVSNVVRTVDGSQSRQWGPWNTATQTPGVRSIVTNYAWTFPPNGDAEPIVHHVQGEVPADVAGAAGMLINKVHPAHLAGGIVVLPGQTQVWSRVQFWRDTTTTPGAGGHYTLDANFGVALTFHPADIGNTVKVDYQLRSYSTTTDQDAASAGDTVYPRRLPLMIEDQVIEGTPVRRDATDVPFGEARLAVKGVDDQPVFTNNLSGGALTTPVHVLAVDLETGLVYTNGAGLALTDTTLSPPLETGFQDGIVTFPVEQGGVRADYVGHTWRFFYRTLNRNSVQMQKAPRYYVDADTARSYLTAYLTGGQSEVNSLADVDYRTYQFTHVAAPNDANRQLGVIEFGQWLSGETWSTAESSGGETVAVSYAYTPTAGKREYVWAELHTVPVGGRKFTLACATLTGNPIEILAVNGVSARAKAWWLNRQGRQLVLDVESLFLANALGGVARVQ